MAVLVAFVGVAQVGVRVDLHHAEILHAGIEVALDHAPGHRVLAAEDNRDFPESKNFLHCF
ncbi:hypothetical protein D3C83_211750 [compost metagenome]